MPSDRSGDDVTVAGMHALEPFVVDVAGRHERVWERAAHRGHRVLAKPSGIEVGVIQQHVAFCLLKDRLTPEHVERIDRSERQQKIAQRRRVEHAGVEHEALGERLHSVKRDAGRTIGIGNGVDGGDATKARLRGGGDIRCAHTAMGAGQVGRELAAVDQTYDERTRQAKEIGNLLRGQVAIVGEYVHRTAAGEIREHLQHGPLGHRWQAELAVLGTDGDRDRLSEVRGKLTLLRRVQLERGRLTQVDMLRAKRHLLRPITYIRAHLDPTWLPPLTTPPFPEHPSGHSVQSAAAAAVLTELFGDGYAFEDHTHDDRGLSARSFTSFAHAAAEAAISRLYGGIHFRPAIELGVDQGAVIGAAVNALASHRRHRR